MRRPLVRLLVFWLIPVGVTIAGTSAGVWLDVPFVKQDQNGCGPASIAMVMQYWSRQRNAPGGSAAGDDANPAAIERAVYSKEGKGTRGSDMQRYFERAGFRAFVFKGEWADLEHHLEKGRPLIVALREGRSFHYVVVGGLDRQQDLVIVNDPAQRGFLKMDRAGFARAWNAAQNWTLLALPGPQQ